MESGRAPLKLRRCSMYDLAREAVDTMTTDGRRRRDPPGVGVQRAARLDLLRRGLRPHSAGADQSAVECDQVFAGGLDCLGADRLGPELAAVEGGRSRGAAFPPDKLEAVFDRFQQVESSDASKKGGTGLGLAICRSIIQQHGGAIWAQPNQNGPGTTLWVQLSRSARASDTGSNSLIAPPAERGEGLILVCDDDPGIRVVVAEQLRQHGYDILEAGSGEEVIALANEQTRGLRRRAGNRDGRSGAPHLGDSAGSVHARA